MIQNILKQVFFETAEIKQIVKDIFYLNNNNNFSIEDALLVAINEYNNKIYSSTKSQPVDIRDVSDLDIINK